MLAVVVSLPMFATEVTVRLRWLEKPGPSIAPIHMDLEEYVAGVLAGEANGFRSEEALKAIAIVARTFAFYSRGRHRAEGFDFCDTTHCQDYRQAGINERLRAIAKSTAGLRLLYRGQIAAAYYTKDCGGKRESVEAVWPDITAPYLAVLTDPYCPRAEWRNETSFPAIRDALTRSHLKVPADLRAITIDSRTRSGRVQRLRLAGVISSELISASSFRFAIGRAIGWDRIPSDLYSVEPSGSGVVFRGRGSGHGVGLCQAGAEAMGGRGKSYREILAFYYPGTELSESGAEKWRRVYGESIQLETTQPDQDRAVLPIADRLWRQLQSRTHLTSTDRPLIRVFPTIPAYRNETGQAGWVAAYTENGTINLQPAAVLRSQGALESTLRHELAHVLVESQIHARLPLWFHEGLVFALTELARPDAPVTFTDEGALNRALAHPTSERERRRAYASAHAMVDWCIHTYTEATVLSWLTRGLPPQATFASITHALTIAK